MNEHIKKMSPELWNVVVKKVTDIVSRSDSSENLTAVEVKILELFSNLPVESLPELIAKQRQADIFTAENRKRDKLR